MFLGELNYLLMSKFQVRDLDSVSGEAQRAASASLVRQHLAMKSLREQGGESLQRILDRQWNDFLKGIEQQGSDLQAYCQRYHTDQPSLRAYRDWETAWPLYLKNRLTDQNLQRFYQTRRDQYAGGKWNVSHLFIPIESDQAGGEALADQRMRVIVAELQPLTGSMSQLEARFAALAKQESDGATAEDGGRLGWITGTGNLPAAVMRQIRQSQAETLLPPIKSSLGLHLVLIHERSIEATSWQELEDTSRVRRDAADALFADLVARQSAAKVVWYIAALRPPQRPMTSLKAASPKTPSLNQAKP